MIESAATGWTAPLWLDLLIFVPVTACAAYVFLSEEVPLTDWWDDAHRQWAEHERERERGEVGED